MDAANINLTSILDNLEKIFTIIAILGGGLWAYFHFIKSRKYRIRIEPSISGEVITFNKQLYLKVKLQLKNAGEAKVEITEEGSGFRLYTIMPKSNSGKSQLAKKERLKTFLIFNSHKWIESNETIVEEQMIAISGDQHFAFELEMRVISNKTSFRTNHIVIVNKK